MMSWQYIAGFFDGEGNVILFQTTDSPRLSPRITITQFKDRGGKLLDEIRAFLADSGIKCNTPYHLNRTGNDDHRLVITGRSNVEGFIKGVFPYLHIKKVECQDCLRWLILHPIIPQRERYRLGIDKNA